MSSAAPARWRISATAQRQILGLQFHAGSVAEAVDILSQGGLLVVPAAPALKELPYDLEYREALLNADVTLTDSAFMVLIWNLLQRDRVPRVSGLAYLRELLSRQDVAAGGKTFWIMPSEASSRRNIAWLRSAGIAVTPEDVYVAPIYGKKLEDATLLEILQRRRPKHVVVAIGGGTQERLGWYLKRHLQPVPAIHCIGAALAFLTGDQVRIPVWADKYYLGWFFRCVWEPTRYVRRYWDARKLLPLLIRYRDRLPTPSQA